MCTGCLKRASRGRIIVENIYADFLHRLQENLHPIVDTPVDSTKKITRNINVCYFLIYELRDWYMEARLSKKDQIIFFKKIKPLVLSELFFQRKALNYFHRKPDGTKKQIKNYINEHLSQSNEFILQHFELHTYIENSANHLDEHYFTQQPYDALRHHNLQIPLDAPFSSPADQTLSELQAIRKFQQFLKFQLSMLDTMNFISRSQVPKPVQWKRTKVDFVELIYALHFSGCLDLNLKELVALFQKVIHVEIGDMYRTFTNIKLKNNPTSFLDELKNGLVQHIHEENEK